MGTVRKENEKVYIEGVRKISWDTGEMCEFASSFVSALNSLGDDISYDYVMGTSGAAFRFTLNPGAWDFTNYGILNIAPDRVAPIQRAFAAAGYSYALYEPGSFQEDAARIMGSIDRGCPVLAFRVVGPSDCCILTGYDEGGQVLLGWSTFQDIPDDHNIPPDGTGYFRKPGWHENLAGSIFIGPKQDRPAPRDVYLNALQWAVYLLRLPGIGQKVTGLEGLRVWAEEMTQAQNFPAGDAALLGQRYLSTTINITMLRDHCRAEPFLRRAAVEVPEFQAELSRAAACYAEAASLRNGMDDLISDNFSPRAMQAIGDPAIRRAFADILLQICDCEEEAANQIELLIHRVE